MNDKLEKIVVKIFLNKRKVRLNFDGQTIEVAPYIPGALQAFHHRTVRSRVLLFGNRSKDIARFTRELSGAQLHL